MNLRAGFPEVSAAVEERSATKIVWNSGTELDQEAAEQLRSLLQRKLTADDAVQIAMLNNRDLQAMYTELGVAQADLVQAGLFKNPILDAAVFFPLSGVRPDFQLSVVVSLLDALYVPLRKRVAAALFEEAKLRVTGAVLDFAAQVRTAFYVHQANEQLLELRQTIVQALTASLDVSRRLHEAGNISDLDLARDRAQTEASKVVLRSAEVAVTPEPRATEQLDGRLGRRDGVGDRRAHARHSGRAPAGERRRACRAGPQHRPRRMPGNASSRRASSSDSTGRRRWFRTWSSGREQSGKGRRPGRWGRSIAVPIPLFDQGQARIGRAVAELRRAQQEYYALAVRIRATARAVQDRIEGAQDRALYYRDILLPLRERIVNEAQLHYNAMQIGIFQLLRDREQQIETGVAYVEALREYWLARADLAQIASGRLPIADRSPGGRGRRADAEKTGRALKRRV